jgi:hypothetical protein
MSAKDFNIGDSQIIVTEITPWSVDIFVVRMLPGLKDHIVCKLCCI